MVNGAALPQNPGDNWDVTTHAKVILIDLNPSEDSLNVEIEQIDNTPAQIDIHRAQYPNGVMLVNENTRPANEIPIIATDHARPNKELKIIKVPHGHEFVNVNIPANDGWPTGKIIIWEP